MYATDRRPAAGCRVRRRTSRRTSRSTRALAAGIAVVLTLAVAACDSSSVRWRSAPRSGASAAQSPGPPLSPADACVASTMASMTVQQMAGQVMLVGTPVSNIAGIDKIIQTYDIGGVFLNGRSHSSAAALRSQISALQTHAPKGVRLLISLDQEGGEVQALQGADFPQIPTAVAQGRLSTPALKAETAGWSKRLAAIGVTLDLAPVADTVPAALGTKNPPIGAFHRQLGSDPTAVATDIGTVVTAVQANGVLTTLKHFPGLGRVLANTDYSNKAVDTVATSHDPYLAPFIAGIKAGTSAVMISSASYPNLDPHSIATFSRPIVTGLLRNQLGFTGLIVSDSLAGAAAISAVPVGQRGVRFIAAGGDLVLTTAAAKAPSMIAGLIAAAHASAGFAAQLKAAATQVVRSKYRAGLLSCSVPRP
jgi:beta-N-acetylhexosaminidase